MIAATWNVNSLRARLPRVLEFLAAHRPDVLLLQETKVGPDQFPEAELREAGYVAHHHSGGRWAGVAILAPEEAGLEPAQAGLPGEVRADEARWVEAVLPASRLRVASVYVVNGRAVGTEPFEEKLRFLDAMTARAAELAGTPLLVGGDFNVAPADVDVYDPVAFAGATHVTGDERSRLVAMQERGDLADAFRVLEPAAPGFTWWDYRQGHFHRGLGLRIDLLLLSRSLAGGLRSCGIDRDFRKGSKPSDHAPLLAEFDPPAPG